MARKGKVFNRLERPKLLRKRISAAEAAVGALLLLLILGMILWLRAQRTNYDPGERDIDTAVLVSQSVADDLYKTPLKRWRDPSLGEAGAAPIDLGPFAPSLLSDGWRTTKSPQTFSPDTLYEKINGQAEQYLKFGFEGLTVLELEHPKTGRTLDVFLYDQGSFEGSLGVYEEQRGDKPVAELEGVHYTPNALGAIGMCGRTFFHAIGDAPDDAVRAMTQRVLKALAKLAEQSAIPAGFETLNKGLGVPFDRIAYLPNNVFQFRFAQRFWFARLEGAANARLFVHAAESPEAAARLFEKLHAEQQEDYEVIEATPTSALYRHDFLKTYFALAREGAMVFGVEKHPQREAIAPVMERLRAALRTDSGGGDGHDSAGEEGEPSEDGGEEEH